MRPYRSFLSNQSTVLQMRSLYHPNVLELTYFGSHNNKMTQHPFTILHIQMDSLDVRHFQFPTFSLNHTDISTINSNIEASEDY